VSRGDLRHAIDHAIAGRWEEAHEIAQAHEGESLFDWLHAVLHKIEGDAGNARYWYGRAGRMKHVDDEATAELAEIGAVLAGPRDRPA
jgi:hypothetical protein